MRSTTPFPGAGSWSRSTIPRALDDEQEARPFFNAGRLTTVASAKNLLESVFAAADGVAYPLLVTTGDNVLMTAHALRAFHSFALAENADGAAMFARKEDMLAAHAEGQPRFWEFRDGAFSGCNTFWMNDRDAFVVGEIFRGGGQFLKFPRRFIAAFGLINLIGFRLGLFTVDRMLARISKRFGKRVQAQIVNDGQLAIDVDTEFSHLVAQRLLRARGVRDWSA